MNNESTKHINWTVVTAFLAVSILISGIAFCLSSQFESGVEKHEDRHSPHKPQLPPPPLGIKLLLHAQELNALSQLTGKPLAIIKEQIKCKPLPEFLEENGITPELFRTVMDEQALQLIRQAYGANIITGEQMEEILEIIKQRDAKYEEKRTSRRQK